MKPKMENGNGNSCKKKEKRKRKTNNKYNKANLKGNTFVVQDLPRQKYQRWFSYPLPALRFRYTEYVMPDMQALLREVHSGT